ncbi:MAG: SufD family Fe-S cluster assembly protein [Candidatus Kariarchaeaceae archaeon]|jgi:Fe-S cluster assembly scaffold protein SufB
MASIELFDTEYTTKDQLIELSNSLHEPEWLRDRRLQAYELYQNLPFDKDTLFYKYTSFRNFDPSKLVASWSTSETTLSDKQFDDFHIVDTGSGIIVNPSDELSEKGVIFDTLHNLINKNEELAKQLADKATSLSSGFDKLGSLSTAFASSILVLYVPDNVVLESPIRKLSLTTKGNQASFGEVIYIFGESSQVALHEVYSSNEGSDSAFLTSVMKTVYLGDNANVKSLMIQDLDDSALFLYSRVSKIDRYAKYRTLSQLQGGEMSRLNSTLDLVGNGAEGYDLFVSFGRRKQRFDIKSEVHHTARDTIGQTHSRQVMMDNSESILRGLIVIPESGVNADSWLTSAGMTVNRGKVNTVPALRIDQNDVKAAHAASVEPLNEDLLFYLQTRGILESDAREMLVKGYFEYVFKFLEDEPATEEARKYLNMKWKNNGGS